MSYGRALLWIALFAALLFGVYLFKLDREVVSRFEGRLWTVPAKVYARPLEFYEGKPLSAEQLEYELGLLGYSETEALPNSPGSYHRWRDHWDIMSRGYRFWDTPEDPIRMRLQLSGSGIASLTDLSNGEPIPIARLEPAYIDGIFPQHGEDRVLLTLEEVPDVLLKMLILTEDRRFFEHNGVDPRSIARAFMANLQAGRTVQGGSTLTQQLVKNLYLDSERSLLRKINEAFMSLLLELHFDKRTILQTYLNEVYLGQDGSRAIHGFGLASEFYFRKPLIALGYEELALLVAMVKGASYYHPVRQTERARLRRDHVLSGMRDAELITVSQYQRLIAKPVTVTQHRRRIRHPAFMTLLQRQLSEQYDEQDLQEEGLHVYSTMDPWVQRQSELAVTGIMNSVFTDRPKLQAASVAASHRSGDVLAVVGGRDPAYHGFNRALDTRRQVGSLIKPVVYLAALSQPERYTLATLVEDSEISLTNELGVVWTPGNYDGEFHGDVLLNDALLRSYNIPAVKVGLDIGLGAIDATWRGLGASSWLPRLPSITLGAVESSPFEIAGIYQTLASDGFDSPLNTVYAVLDNHGEPLTRSRIEVSRKVDGAAVKLVNHALASVAREGTAARLARELEFAVAGKTGTSDDTRDSWFAGYTSDIVAVTWMGYDDNSSTGLTGSSGAMRLWSTMMSSISTSDYIPQRGADIELHPVDRDSGLLGGKGCENTIELAFVKGSQPTQDAPCRTGVSRGWFDRLFGD